MDSLEQLELAHLAIVQQFTQPGQDMRDQAGQTCPEAHAGSPSSQDDSSTSREAGERPADSLANTFDFLSALSPLTPSKRETPA